jgi:hypothetical protein
MEAVCREHDTDLATAALQASVNDSPHQHDRHRLQQTELVAPHPDRAEC